LRDDFCEFVAQLFKGLDGSDQHLIIKQAKKKQWKDIDSTYVLLSSVRIQSQIEELRQLNQLFKNISFSAELIQ
jgi:hypothetical protein